MPCNSDYMLANARERELSKVACFLDELAGKTWSQHDYKGYHPAVYAQCISKADADAMVKRLCDALQTTPVTRMSLEMQIWWRDHQAADHARVLAEMEAAQTAEAKLTALAKLTPYERSLLKVG